MKKRNFRLALKAFLITGFVFGFAACSSDDNDGGEEIITYSPYITKVYDFMPAIGQFVNEAPRYENGDTKERMIAKAEKEIIGINGGIVSLGGFGGYIVFGFDHTIQNVQGKKDFRVKGNAIYSATNPNPNDQRKGGSCEPGIIMVAYDLNKNGKPDDKEWYEIAGSEYSKSATIKDYEITYYRSEENAPSNKYIRWTDNKGGSGYKIKDLNHSQSYFPEWITEDEITFKGTRLADNAVDESGDGTYWVSYAYDWGYADNHPNDNDASAIDIDWAVNTKGEKVNLPGIDFIKVYTAINQEAGWTGEISTEITGAEDLHIK